MTRLDWMAVGLMLAILSGFVGALFLYLRAAYRKGGWSEVKTSFVVAILALIAFYVVRVVENSDLQMLKSGVDRITR